MTTASFWERLRFFKPAEFDTKGPDGKKVPRTGEMNMKERFMLKADRLRFIFGKPLNPNSGYRSPEHNMDVSSTGAHGPHTTGHATDFGCTGHNTHALLHAAVLVAVVEAGYLNEQEAQSCLKEIEEKKLGFTGIGVAKTFLHLDDLTEKDAAEFAVRPNVWTY